MTMTFAPAHKVTTHYNDYGTHARCSCGELDNTFDNSRDANEAIDAHADKHDLLDLRP